MIYAHQWDLVIFLIIFRYQKNNRLDLESSISPISVHSVQCPLPIQLSLSWVCTDDLDKSLCLAYNLNYAGDYWTVLCSGQHATTASMLKFLAAHSYKVVVQRKVDNYRRERWICSNPDSQRHLTRVDMRVLQLLSWEGNIPRFYNQVCSYSRLGLLLWVTRYRIPSWFSNSKVIDSGLGITLSIWETPHFGKERKVGRRSSVRCCPPLTLDILHIKSPTCMLITPLIKQ